MKIRTKMLSYATAVLMMASTLLSFNPFTIDAFAASEGNGTSSHDGGFGVGKWNTNSSVDPMIQVYLTSEEYCDSKGENGYNSLSDNMTWLTRHTDGGKEIERLTKWRSNGSIYIFPTTESPSFKNIIVDVEAGSVDPYNISDFTSILAAVESDSPEVLTATELENTKKYGSLGKLFKGIDMIDPHGEKQSDGSYLVEIDIGSQLFKNYKDYRQNIKYNPDTEWKEIIEPYLQILEDDKVKSKDAAKIRAAAEDCRDGGFPVSLAFEVYMPTTGPDGYAHYVGVQAIQSYGCQTNVTPTSYNNATWKVDRSSVSKNSLLYGVYYAYPALKDALRPAYNKDVVLPSDEKELWDFYDTNPEAGGEKSEATRVGGGGWAYYSFCTQPGFRVQVDLTKKWKLINLGDKPLTDAEKTRIKNASLASVSIFGPIDHEVLRKDITAKTGKKAPKTITPEYLYDYIMDHVTEGGHYMEGAPDHYNWGAYIEEELGSSQILPGRLKPTNGWFATSKNTRSISVIDKKKPSYFFLFESGVTSRPKVGFETRVHEEYPVAVLKYDPVSNTCEWYNVGEDPDMYFSLTKSMPAENEPKKDDTAQLVTIGIKLTNKIDVSSGSTDVNIKPIIADTIVLDTDKYYVTDYDPEFGFDSDPSDDVQDNKQFVYENSDVVSADKKYEPAYSPEPTAPALNNDIPAIIEEAKDSEIMTLDTPTVNTDYTCKNNYSVYFNILGKAKYDTKRDYILNYEVLGDDPDSLRWVDTTFEYSPISDIKIEGWGENITLGEYFNTDADDTLKLDFYGDTGAEGLLIKDTTPEAIADYMTQYSDYCKNYSVYEAAVAASTNQIAYAVMYWTKAAQEAYCEILDIKRDFEDEIVTFSTAKSELYDPEIEWHNTKRGGYDHPGYEDPASINSDNKALAEECEAKLKEITPKLYDITGWTTQWSLKYCPYKRTGQRTCNTAYTTCNSYRRLSEDTAVTISGAAADNAAAYSSSGSGRYSYRGRADKNKLNFSFKTANTSEVGVKYGNTPSAVKSLLKEVKNNGVSTLTNDFYTAGILGKLCDTLSNQLIALADLEESRPHAEIKIYCDYEVPFDNGVFIDDPSKNAVPEYLVAVEWADQKPFMKEGTLLTSLLDFDGRATTPEALLPRVSGKTLSTATRDSVDAPVMLMKYDSAKIPTSDLKFQYDVKDEDSGSDKTITKPVIRWSYADWTNLKAAYDALIADENMEASSDIVKELLKNFNFTLKSDAAATEESSEWVETKHGRYLVNMLAPEIMENAAFTATELDACAYVIPKVAVWTSIWRLENGNEGTDANSANVYLPIEDWLKAWKVEDSFNTVADNSAKLGSTQSSPITISGSGVTYLDLYKAQMANMADKGAEAVVGVDTTVSNRSTYKEKGTTEVSTRIVYPSQILNTINASYYLSRGADVRAKASVEKPDIQTKFDDASWISSAVPLKLTSQFSHFNISWTDAPESGHDNDMVLKRTDEADGAEAVKGVYNRDNTYTVFPMVKTGYFEPSDKDPIYNYAFVSGQESRTFTERTFYKVGILGAATPTVVANMIASDARAQHLRDLHNGAPVAYSGTGLTVSYDTSAMVIAMQTFSLINKDAGEAYQEGWGDDNLASKALNDGEGTSAHSEFLEMMGGTQVSAGSGNVGMAIPYVAGSDIAMNTDGTIRNHAWQLASQTAGSAIETETYASTHSATDIQLIVEKAELVGIILPEGSNVVGTAQFEGIDEDKDSSIGDDNMMGVANSGTFISDKGALDACGATGVTPRTTAATLKMLAKMGGGYAQIAEALRGIGINGSEEDFLKRLFAHNKGDKITTEDMIRLGYSSEQAKKIADSMKANLTKAESDKWYNEYCNCLALRYECTTFKMQPVILTDKIPIEMGPQTPADHSLYFSNGYDFTAAAMLLKFLGAEDGDAQAMAEERGLTSGNEGETMFDVWYIGRNDGNVTYGNTIDAEGDTRADIHNITDLKPDVVISDVPATNANF